MWSLYVDGKYIKSIACLPVKNTLHISGVKMEQCLRAEIIVAVNEENTNEIIYLKQRYGDEWSKYTTLHGEK